MPQAASELCCNFAVDLCRNARSSPWLAEAGYCEHVGRIRLFSGNAVMRQGHGSGPAPRPLPSIGGPV
ncbi:hypothetical protein SPHV1_2230079 [Novosphingobium sp. KN65.2]|nr:hypothetical protein SPHV1_2230079 [Novosphingobium sp. KN65.2]